MDHKKQRENTLEKRRSRSSAASPMALVCRSPLAACCLAAVAALLVVLLLGPAVECQEQLTVESRQAKEQAASENELADTIKYLEKLEKLDKYWSEVARPR